MSIVFGVPFIGPIPSSNYHAWRYGYQVDRVILHHMDGSFAAANSIFNMTHGTSAHYGIRLDGYAGCWVDEDHTCYAAGGSLSAPSWIPHVNERSINIEHEDLAQDKLSSFTFSEELYDTSALMVADICARHAIPIDRDHIIRHNEASSTVCSGGLDIDLIVRRAKMLEQMAKDIARVRQILEARETIPLVARLQRGLDVEYDDGRKFDPASKPLDARVIAPHP